MIMLPLHGQNTAAIKINHWADKTLNQNQKAMFLLNRWKIFFAEFLYLTFFIYLNKQVVYTNFIIITKF